MSLYSSSSSRYVPSKAADVFPRVYALDGTRGLAVLLVFFVHYHTLFSGYVFPHSFSFNVSEFLGTIGHIGVDLFFVLSGYLIYGILIQTSPRYATFLWRRVKRIYPTFLCVLALYIALSFLFPSRSKLPSSFSEACVYVLQNVSLLPGILPILPIITVAWTLSFEFVFYLSLPLLVGICGMRSWRRRYRVLLFVNLVLIYLGLSAAALSSMHLRFAMFFVGILLREILSYKGVEEKLTRSCEVGAIFFCVGILVLIYWVCFHPLPFNHIPMGVPLSAVVPVFLMAAGSFAFGLYCFGSEGILGKTLSWFPLRKLGEISYSYYLIHGLTLNGIALVMKRWIPPTGNAPVLFWTILPCSFAITLATATILFTLVEKPYSLPQRRAGTLPQPDRLSSPVTVVASAGGISVQKSAT